MKKKIASIAVCLGLLLGICTVVKPAEVKAADIVIDFGTVTEGYMPIDPQVLASVTIMGHGNEGAYIYTSDKQNSDFEFTARSPEINNSTWINYIKPKDGLHAGVYQEFITTNGYADTIVRIVFTVTAAEEPVTVEENDDPGQQLVTFLDTSGNTVKVEWVDYGHDATPPAGYGTYIDYTNVTSHRDLKPIAAGTVQAGNGYTVPNTIVK